MLFLSVAFAFYFFDISLVFQDEFIVRSCGDALTSGYLVVRSLASVLTGGGFVTAFWILLCDYLNETRRTMFVMPPVVFAIASVAMLVVIPDGDLQRFWFWSCLLYTSGSTMLATLILPPSLPWCSSRAKTKWFQP